MRFVFLGMVYAQCAEQWFKCCILKCGFSVYVRVVCVLIRRCALCMPRGSVCPVPSHQRRKKRMNERKDKRKKI